MINLTDASKKLEEQIVKCSAQTPDIKINVYPEALLDLLTEKNDKIFELEEHIKKLKDASTEIIFNDIVALESASKMLNNISDILERKV